MAAPFQPEAVDTFSGCGGWSTGLAMLGSSDIGVEHWAHAAASAHAAGHHVIRADVAQYPPSVFSHLAGLIGSPPCQTFSMAGGGSGRRALAALRSHVLACRHGWVQPEGDLADPRTELVLEPLRWALTMRPRWIALEQVREVLPLWHSMGLVLEDHGYAVWTGTVDAVHYGVGQHRKRALLLASLDGQPREPARTHGGDGQPPLVTMAEALGWDVEAGRVGFPRLDDRGDSPDGYRTRDWFDVHEPSPTLTEKARSWRVELNPGALPGRNRRNHSLDEPAPTIAFGHAACDWRWELNTGRDWPSDGTGRDGAQTVPMDEPAPTVTGLSGGQWQFRPKWASDRPATTLAGDSRVWPPGHKVNADDVRRLGAEEAAERYGDRAGTDAVRLTVPEALALQSFPRGYPLTGPKSAQFLQVGNAVPPLLARAALHEVRTCRPLVRRARTELAPIETAEQGGMF